MSKAELLEQVREYYRTKPETTPEPKTKTNALRCESCGKEVTSDDYSQTEQAWFGGQRVPVTAYYCGGCAATLQAVGDGEYTAMDDRRQARTDSPEPAHKG